jgi:flagellar protein FliS
MEQGGDIAKNLQSLYSYMFSQLIEANMEKKTQPIIVVIDLLKELRAAWVEINKKSKSQTTQHQVPQALPQQSQDNTEKRIRVTG